MNRLLLLLVLLGGCVLPDRSEIYESDDDDSASQSAMTAREDTDGDGMTDSWENEYGYDLNDPSDATLDDDGDGRDTLQEFTDDTDPWSFDGPDSPWPTSPVGGVSVSNARPELVFLNATSPLGDTLTYTLEVYSDELLTTLVTSTAGLAEVSGGTSWTVDVTLTEDATFWWRVGASDPYVMGEWSDPVSFVVDVVGLPPTVPVPVSPSTGDSVPAGSVDLVWLAATSPEGEDVHYEVTLWDASGATELASAEVPGEDVAPQESWTVTYAMVSGTEYSWSVEAIDEADRPSGPSERQVFGYDVADEAPSAPTFTAPQEGDAIDDPALVVVLASGLDPEGGLVSHELELSRDENFAPVAWTVTADPTDATEVSIDLDDEQVVLDLDITWYLRARAVDPNDNVSPWTAISIFVRGPNDAPSVPLLGEPVPTRVTSPITTFAVSGSVDPEGDAIVYEILVAEDAGLDQVIESGSAAPDEDGVLTWENTVDLAGGAWWSARAVDADGAASPWAEAVYFVALDPSWGCSMSHDGGSGPWWLVLVGLLSSAILRARRSHADCKSGHRPPHPRP